MSAPLLALRRIDRQLCRDRSAANCDRHEARSGSAATLSAILTAFGEREPASAGEYPAIALYLRRRGTQAGRRKSLYDAPLEGNGFEL